MTQSRAPLIVAIVLLLLPVLYVGSYLALVVPKGTLNEYDEMPSGRYFYQKWENYRLGGDWSDRFFWPLEQIDRKVRPEAWGPTRDLDFRFSGGLSP